MYLTGPMTGYFLIFNNSFLIKKIIDSYVYCANKQIYLSAQAQIVQIEHFNRSYMGLIYNGKTMYSCLFKKVSNRQCINTFDKSSRHLQYHSKVISHSLALLLQVSGHTQSDNESTIHSNLTRHY